MTTLLAAGTWPCTVLSAVANDNEKRIFTVQIVVRIEEGPSTGRVTTYEDQVNAKSALYIGRSCKAVGWKGVVMETLKDDAAVWIAKTGGKSTVEIRHIEFKDKRTGEPRIWDKANAIGGGRKPLVAASPSSLAEANEAMRRAMADDVGGYDEPQPDDKIPF